MYRLHWLGLVLRKSWDEPPKQAEKMKEVFEVFNARDQHDVSIRGVKAGLRRQKKRMSVDAFHRWFEHMGSCPGCWVCDKLGVMRKISRPIDPHRETRPAHTWHMDTITWSERSVERNKYLTVLRCAACPYYIGIPHGARSDIPDLIEAWILEMRNDPLFKGFQYTVCSLIICDSAGEWTEFSQDNHRAGYGRWDGSKKWQEMRARVGFDCHYTCLDRKEENATAERSCAEHDTVMGALRSAQDVIEGILNATQALLTSLTYPDSSTRRR